MEKIFEVAKYFLSKEAMNNRKLNKLCYYAQAIHLAIRNRPLMYDAEFDAWIYGPVCEVLYAKYSPWQSIPIQQSCITSYEFNNPSTKSFLDQIYQLYGKYTGDQLASFTKQDEPWKKARGDTPKNMPVTGLRIRESWMREFYRPLVTETPAKT